MAGASRRHWIPFVASGLIVAGVLAWVLVNSLVIQPGLAAEDPRVFMTRYLTALRWGFPVGDQPAIDGVFLASQVEVTGPASIPYDGEFDEERQFVVGYRSVWRESTGAPPGHRLRFVYIGRDSGENWRVLGSGTGP